MNRGHRAFVPGIHGLEHIEGFFAADLAHDNAVGTHAQAVDQQLPLLDSALPFNIGRPGFKAHNVFLRQAKFGGVFNRHDAFIAWNVLRKNVQKGGFAGAGAPGDENADPGFYRRAKHLHHFRRDALELNQLIGCQGACPEAANGHGRSVQRQGWNDGIHARAVGQSGIDHRRGFIHPAAHARHDPVDDLQQVAIVAKRRIHPLQKPVFLNKNMIFVVDQDV